MQFHKTLAMWDEQKSQLDALRFVPENRKVEIFYYEKMKSIAARDQRGDVRNILLMEYRWIRDRRPYYKVYPCIVDALCKLRLDAKFQCPEVPQGQISIRFALGKEPSTKDGIKIGSLFIAGVNLRTPSGKESKGMTIFAKLLNPPNSDFEPFFITFDPNPHHYKSVDDLLENGQDPNSSLRNEQEPYRTMRKEAQALAIRIALTTCMIADDPDIITRDVLAEKQGEYDSEKNEERKRRAEEKAKNRGVFGWSIGKKFQGRANSPHYTNTYLAVRYKGKGRKTAEIVAVRGYWTGKDKLTTVPTGHIREDGTEVENGQVVEST